MLKIKDEVFQFFAVRLLKTFAHPLDQILRCPKENEAMKAQNLDLLPQAPDQLAMLKGAFCVALVGTARERVFDDINTAVVHYEKGNCNNNTRPHAFEETEGSNHTQDQKDKRVVNAWQLEPRVIQPLNQE